MARVFDGPLESECLSNEDGRKRVAMTALISTSELVSDGDSGHDRTTYTDDIFRTLPLWLLQHFIASEQGPHSAAVADNLQVVMDSALEFLQIRSNDGETPKLEQIRVVVGNVDERGQCLIDTILATTHIHVPVDHSQHQLLDEAREQPDRLFGPDEARQTFESEYGLNLDKVDDVANFRYKFVRGDFQSGCTELLWAAEKYGIHWVIVSQVNGLSCLAVT